MRFWLAPGIIAAGVCYFEFAVAQTWYWCDPARAYYPYVATCSVPWRAVNPTTVAPQPSITARSLPRIGIYGQLQGSAADQYWYQHPERHCDRPELRSQGAINGLNSTIGRLNGVPARVVGFEEPMVPVGNQQDPRQSNCHVTLVFGDGRRETGTMHIDDPGSNEPLNVTWTSDASAAAAEHRQWSIVSECEEQHRMYRGCVATWSAMRADLLAKQTNEYSRRMFERQTPPGEQECGTIKSAAMNVGCPDWND
jgi:hypothetical protein